MLRLPMHPRYSRMLLEAASRHCVPAAALCAALVSGRDLLMRLGRDDKHIAEARELFEASQESDFYRLILAYRFARQRNFNVEACRRYGVHAQTARQVEQTCEQILQIARQQGLIRAETEEVNEIGAVNAAAVSGICNARIDAAGAAHTAALRPSTAESDPLLPCLMAGFIDQLCVRRDRGTLECDLAEGRHGTLMRESVVQEAPLFVAASIREVDSRSGRLTLLGLATAVKREWIETMFPQDLSTAVEYLYDRAQKRVAAVKLVRFLDLVIHHEHQREVEPAASGLALAQAFMKGWFELPLFNHEIKQFIARVRLVTAALPELGFPTFTSESITACLARAFAGLTLTKEAQATHLREAFIGHLPKGQTEWLNELAPTQVTWPDGRQLKLLYSELTADAPEQICPPELQVKLHECFSLKDHPRICEAKVPVKLWLCGPDGKRLESTLDWPAFRTGQYPKLKSALQKRYPGVAWV
jgi:ATP-dependent helicase HrpB